MNKFQIQFKNEDQRGLNSLLALIMTHQSFRHMMFPKQRAPCSGKRCPKTPNNLPAPNQTNNSDTLYDLIE